MTRFRRSSLEPDSWSAAVSKNFSVLVADGSIASVDDLSMLVVVSTVVKVNDWVGVVVILAPAPPAPIGDVVTVVVGAVPFEPNEADDMSEGATVAGGVKNVPSSNVSRKSLWRKSISIRWI